MAAPAAAVVMGCCVALDTALVRIEVLRPIESEVEDEADEVACRCCVPTKLLVEEKADAVEAKTKLEDMIFMVLLYQTG